mgnify:CR=1 FL=1
MPGGYRLLLARALQQAARWRDAGHTIPVAVNISANNLLDAGFIGALKDLLAQATPNVRELRWVRTAGGAGYDYGHGVAVDSRGDVIVAGAVAGEAAFGDTVVANEAGAHLFVAKYHADGELVWVKVATGNIVHRFEVASFGSYCS